MRVKTSNGLQLEVEKRDEDGDVLIASHYGLMYVPSSDVPTLIKALEWAIGKRKKRARGEAG
jgi:hypothetical protein